MARTSVIWPSVAAGVDRVEQPVWGHSTSADYTAVVTIQQTIVRRRHAFRHMPDEGQRGRDDHRVPVGGEKPQDPMRSELRPRPRRPRHSSRAHWSSSGWLGTLREQRSGGAAHVVALVRQAAGRGFDRHRQPGDVVKQTSKRSGQVAPQLRAQR